METLSDRSVLSAVEMVKSAGPVADINLFSVMKDEGYFLPAFFDHYRKLGVQHFFVLDDRSTDGTADYLSDQPDCTLLKCGFTYGQRVKIRGRFRFWKNRETRIGVELKRLLPRRFCEGKWCIYADADEFLLLPVQFSGLAEFLCEMDARGHSLAVSSMTVFYPERLRDIEGGGLERPRSLDDLIAVAPFLEGLPTIQFDQESRIRRAGVTVDQRLLQKHGLVGPGERGWGGSHKVSIFRPGRSVYLTGSHNASKNPSPDFLNCVAHFKYTPDLIRRIQLAIETRAWAFQSSKYVLLAKLLEKMRKGDDSFVGEKSRRYLNRGQLESFGLMKFKA